MRKGANGNEDEQDEKRGCQTYDALTTENHLFVSQFLPETAWFAGNAMKRNSVIIGLSDAMIIVESGETGGTFAAGKEALSLKHPLFVVDFEQPGTSAKANPYFMSKGGVPVRRRNGVPNLDDIYDTINKRQYSADNDFFGEAQLQLSVGL